MIEDSRQFFTKHPEEETRRRGLALVALVTGLRDGIMGGGSVVIPESETPPVVRPAAPAAPLADPIPAQEPQPRKYKTIAQRTKEHTLHTLAQTRGDTLAAAKILHVSRQTIYSRMAEWQVDPKDFRC